MVAVERLRTTDRLVGMDDALIEGADAGGPDVDVPGRRAPPEGSQPTSKPAPKISRSCPPIVEESITQLWAPADGSEIVADLCFVHGLGGHPGG